MDSGSEIDFNDLPERTEFDTDFSEDELGGDLGERRERGAKARSREASPRKQRDESPDSVGAGAEDSSLSLSRAEEVGHRSSSSEQEEEENEKSSSSTTTESSSAPKVEVEGASDSEDDVTEDLAEEDNQPLKPESRKVSAVSETAETASRRSASPEPSPSPQRDASPSPSPSPRAEESPAREESPVPRDASVSPPPTARAESMERKSSHGSSSYGEERANSLSPEPAEPISVPYNSAAATAKQQESAPSSQKDITRIYTDKLVNEKPVDSFAEKIVRNKPQGGDITQIYTASIQAQKEQQSPRLERARGGKPVKDITQLYTANLNKPADGTASPGGEMASPNRPRRNDNITKLYTNGFDSAKNNFKGKPSDEITNPRKHNMSTSADKEGIREAYNQVMDDHSDTEWAVFKFDETNRLVVSGTGSDVSIFKSQFGPDDRGFGYVKVQTGDEMSKRSRFVLVTWVGANISVMKKAKMSTDKLLVKEIIQNLSVEIQTENSHELSYDHLKSEVDKAGGARYGTGVREK